MLKSFEQGSGIFQFYKNILYYSVQKRFERDQIGERGAHEEAVMRAREAVPMALPQVTAMGMARN